jgi:hypothetical protein
MSVGNVVSLLGAMRKASSPLAKAKLLALTVRGVHQLSGAERRELVTRLGVDKADWFADRLGEGSNETTAEVMRELIRQAGKTDPGKWQELAAKLSDPEERGRLLAEGLEMLDELPADEDPGATVAESTPSLPADTVPVPPAPPTPKPVAPTPEIQPAPPKPVTTKSPSKPKPRPPVAPAPAKPAAAPKKTAPPAAKPSRRGPARFTEPAPGQPTKAVGKPAVERRQAPQMDAARETTRPFRSRPRTATPTGDLAEDLAATGSLVRRLGLLRERSAEAKILNPEGLRRLVEVFPPGWARRRALSSILTAGIPGDFEAALGLVAETLESPTDRRWCLGSLAASRELTPHQREALLATLESPGWRRRLAKRLAAISTG